MPGSRRYSAPPSTSEPAARALMQVGVVAHERSPAGSANAARAVATATANLVGLTGRLLGLARPSGASLLPRHRAPPWMQPTGGSAPTGPEFAIPNAGSAQGPHQVVGSAVVELPAGTGVSGPAARRASGLDQGFHERNPVLAAHGQSKSSPRKLFFRLPGCPPYSDLP